MILIIMMKNVYGLHGLALGSWVLHNILRIALQIQWLRKLGIAEYTKNCITSNYWLPLKQYSEYTIKVIYIY